MFHLSFLALFFNCEIGWQNKFCVVKSEVAMIVYLIYFLSLSLKTVEKQIVLQPLFSSVTARKKNCCSSLKRKKRSSVITGEKVLAVG